VWNTSIPGFALNLQRIPRPVQKHQEEDALATGFNWRSCTNPPRLNDTLEGWVEESIFRGRVLSAVTGFFLELCTTTDGSVCEDSIQ
jgi:hypothetical protein